MCLCSGPAVLDGGRLQACTFQCVSRSHVLLHLQLQRLAGRQNPFMPLTDATPRGSCHPYDHNDCHPYDHYECVLSGAYQGLMLQRCRCSSASPALGLDNICHTCVSVCSCLGIVAQCAGRKQTVFKGARKGRSARQRHAVKNKVSALKPAAL